MRTLGRSVLSRVRRRPSARRIQLLPPLGRGGNLMYLWQWAYLARTAGERAYVLHSPAADDWIAEFPLLEQLTIAPSDVRLLDDRVLAARFYYGVDFTRGENLRFCRALLASSPRFRQRMDGADAHLDASSVVINVRRGDYYSDPRFTWAFGIDVAAHVREAIEILQREGREVSDVVVVSDDVDWCRENLAGVLPSPIRTVPGRTGPFDDLAVLASASTLVLANSTFSYWGAHIAAARGRGQRVIAPSHHEILDDGSEFSVMLDPAWERTSRRPFPPEV